MKLKLKRSHWATAVAATTAALAQSSGALAGDGLYFGLQGGVNQVDEQTLRIQNADFGLVPLGPDFANGTRISRIDYDNGWLAGLVMGYAFRSGLRLELDLARRENDADRQRDINGGVGGSNRNGEVSADTAMANIWLDLFKSRSIHPYIGGGYGGVRIELDDPAFRQTDLRKDRDTVGGYQAGAGIGFDLSPHWTLSLDYRYLSSEDATLKVFNAGSSSRVETDYTAQTAMATLRYYFSADEPAPPPPPPVAEAPPAAVIVPPPPADSDGDGVTDDLDQCPATPAGVKVDGVGCPLPRCKSPEPGEQVSLDGCATGDVIVLRGVNFEFDQSRLTANAQRILDGVGDSLIKAPGISIELGGHTDSLGSDEYNQRLSERRAAAVRQYLAGKGVERGRMTSRGYGESAPLADNGDEPGRESNRRVELKVTEGRAIIETPVPAAGATAAP